MDLTNVENEEKDIQTTTLASHMQSLEADVSIYLEINKWKKVIPKRRPTIRNDFMDHLDSTKP